MASSWRDDVQPQFRDQAPLLVLRLTRRCGDPEAVDAVVRDTFVDLVGCPRPATAAELWERACARCDASALCRQRRAERRPAAVAAGTPAP